DPVEAPARVRRTSARSREEYAVPGIRTTTVGSWPIPFGKRPALKRYYAGELDDAAAGEVLQAAARIVMDEQIACGLAQIMGGGHSFDSQLENLARIVEREVLDMVEAGAGEVQIDAPTEAILAAESARSVEDIARWLRFPFRSVPEATTRTVHFCLGDIARK